MKKSFFFIALILVAATAVNAQRYAIVDTRYILEKMPAYGYAQKQLDQTSAEWQKEIDTKQAALDKMYKDYDVEQVMLSDELKKKREDEIFIREKEVRELRLELSPLNSVEKSRKNPRAYRCTACGGRKAFGARQCRRCWRLSVEQMSID